MDAQEFRTLLFDTLGWDKDSSDEDWGWGWIAESLDRYDVSNIAVVDQHEHTEGNWRTELYVVFEVDPGVGPLQYFKKTGYYMSHDGAYWDGNIVEVSPQKQTVTVWNERYDYDSFDSYF